MSTPSTLNCHLVSDDPTPMYLGELPRRFEEIPARVVLNFCPVQAGGSPVRHVCLLLPMADTLDQGMLPSRSNFERHLHAAHPYAAAEATYWHCHAGINRSAMALAAYLHLYRGQRISAAIALLRRRRSDMVLCNSLFERTLREWYGDPDEQDFEPFSFETYLRGRGI
jgi:protein-tyrosine phosphatase